MFTKFFCSPRNNTQRLLKSCYWYLNTNLQIYKNLSFSSRIIAFLPEHNKRCLHVSSQSNDTERSNKESFIPRKGYINSISKSSAVVHLKDLEDHMRIRGYSALRWGLALIALTGFGLYYFREPVKDKISVEVSDVASRSLGDQNVVMKANEVTRTVLFEVMNDPEALSLAVSFFSRLLTSEEVVKTATNLFQEVITNPNTRKNASILAGQTVNSLLEREDIREMLQIYIKSLLLDESTQTACVKLLKLVFTVPEVQDMLADLLSEVIKKDIVHTKATELGKGVASKVVNDALIQEQTGSAMWNAVTYALTPRWFSTSKTE